MSLAKVCHSSLKICMSLKGSSDPWVLIELDLRDQRMVVCARSADQMVVGFDKYVVGYYDQETSLVDTSIQ